MAEQRSILLFESGIKSAEARKNYKFHLKAFLAFTKIKDYDSLTKVSPDLLQELLEDYVMHLKKTINPNSVSTYMTGLKHFFVMNRVKVYWEIIQKMYPEQVKKSGQKPWTDEDIQKLLEYSTSQRNKAIVLFMASTGARIGIHNYPLQMQHLRDMDDGCKTVVIYAGDKDEYWAFLTPEATKYLQDYFDQREDDNEKFYPDTPIFRHTYRLGFEKTKQVNKGAAVSMISRLIKTAKIKRVKINSKNYDKHMDHAFRKRFNTILKINNDVNSNIAEKIMGHKNGLDGVYFVPTIEQCFAEFRKAIPQLTVSDSARKQAELDKVRQEKSELQRATSSNKRLQTQIDQIKEQMFEDRKKKLS